MTQPAPPPPSGSSGQIIAAAAIGLALIALEAQVRQDIQDAVNAAFTAIAAAGLLAAATAPATIITGVALLSLAGLHKAITGNLTAARDRTRNTVAAGYTAAANAAYIHTRDELGDTDLPDTLPELGDNLDRLLADLDTTFGHAQTDVQNSILAAYDGVQGPDADVARRLTINEAVTQAGDRTSARANATGAVAVHAGSTDAQQALFEHYQNTTGEPGLMKRWKVTAVDPCGMCEALDGTVVGIRAEFDANATTVDKDLRRVWRNLQGPPRHPNCRCQIELVRT